MSYLQKFTYSWGALGRVGVFVWQHKLVPLYLLPWLFVQLLFSDLPLITVRADWFPNPSPLVRLVMFFYGLVFSWIFVFFAICMTRYTLEAIQGKKPSFWGAMRLPRLLWANILIWGLAIAVIFESGFRTLCFMVWSPFQGYAAIINNLDMIIRFALYVCTPYVFVFMVGQQLQLHVGKAFVRAVKFLWNHLLESCSLIVLLLITLDQVLAVMKPFRVRPPFGVQNFLGWFLLTVTIVLPVIIYHEKSGEAQA